MGYQLRQFDLILRNKMSHKVLSKGRHRCFRENCQGNSKDYDNYLHDHPRPKSRLKPQKTTRSCHSLHDKVKFNKARKENPPKMSQEISRDREQLSEIKRENERLHEIITDRNRKIGDLKNRLKETEVRLRSYQQKLVLYEQQISQNNKPTSPMTAQPQNEGLMRNLKEQARLLEQSQRSQMESMQKYRQLDEEFHEYRLQSERKMTALIKENSQLKVVQQSTFKDYDEQISSLKKELHRLSEHQHSPPPFMKTEGETDILKSSHRELMAQREELLCRIQQKQRRQRQLTVNLQAINAKVERWGEQYKSMVADRRRLEEEYQALQAKYDQKRQRHAMEKSEWSQIFQELMREVDKLKREISRLERSNHKLVNIYTQVQDD